MAEAEVNHDTQYYRIKGGGGVASENGPLVLILQSYSQIFIVKHIDLNLVELIWTTKNCEISSVSGLVTKPSDQ